MDELLPSCRCLFRLFPGLGKCSIRSKLCEFQCASYMPLKAFAALSLEHTLQSFGDKTLRASKRGMMIKTLVIKGFSRGPRACAESCI